MRLTSWLPEHWDAKQREVWQNFETHWQCLIDAKIPEFLKYIHPDFIGFGHESPLPVDKPWLEKWVGFWAKTSKFLICELRPINVKVHGDIAILQCLIFTISENEKRMIRRYTMTWKKQGDHWVVIASHNNLSNEAGL